MPATGFMAPTLLWLKRHDPALLDRIRTVLLPKDYVRLKMTGEIATDPSDAAATACFDVTAKRWASAIIEGAGLPGDIFPPVLDSQAVAGTLTSDAADALGLAAGIPVVAGCADQPAQAIGNGMIAPGKTAVIIGSGGQVVTPLIPAGTRIPTDPRLHVFNHAIPGMWYILGAILAAGLSLRWLRHAVGQDDAGKAAYERFSAEAERVKPGADGLIFLPYLSGERTPHMDARARGGFIGLSYHHEQGHLARAVMEGVAFALRECLELSIGLGGAVEGIIATGGGIESGVWRGIVADVLGLPLQKSLMTEQAGVGAALVAGVGTGMYASFEDAGGLMQRYGAPTEPDAGRQAVYNALYAEYRALYPKLRENFHTLSEL
jgi:xylulokinase